MNKRILLFFLIISAFFQVFPVESIKGIVDNFINKSAGPKENTTDDYRCFPKSDFEGLPSYNKNTELPFCYCICNDDQSSSRSNPSHFCANLKGQCESGSASLQCKIVSKNDKNYGVFKI